MVEDHTLPENTSLTSTMKQKHSTISTYGRFELDLIFGCINNRMLMVHVLGKRWEAGVGSRYI